MRVISKEEKMQRGCLYCKDMKKARHNGPTRTCCPYDVCPYHVLDKYETYEQFMESEDCKIMVDGFFQTVASCYELRNGGKKVNRIISDGDSRMYL